MIICPKCGKENQDHYKFCLGCGNELPREGGPRGPMRPTPAAANPAQRPAAPFAAPVTAPATPGPFGGGSSPNVSPVVAAPVAPVRPRHRAAVPSWAARARCPPLAAVPRGCLTLAAQCPLRAAAVPCLALPRVWPPCDGLPAGRPAYVARLRAAIAAA